MIRLAHDIAQLEGGVYGNVVGGRQDILALTRLVGCWAVISLLVTSNALSQNPADAYEAAFQRWVAAIEAHPELGDAFWFRTDKGPADLRSAAVNLIGLGPNLLPLIVKALRQETDQMRVYRLILLLNAVSGINLYYDSGEENFFAAAPRFKARFLATWDAGKYANAVATLRKSWRSSSRITAAAPVDPDSTIPFRRYGVFAIPFIVDTLQKQDSPEAFAAFPIITGDNQAYASYIRNPAGTFQTREQKVAFARKWAAQNAHKFDRLTDLHARIASIAK